MQRLLLCTLLAVAVFSAIGYEAVSVSDRPAVSDVPLIASTLFRLGDSITVIYAKKPSKRTVLGPNVTDVNAHRINKRFIGLIMNLFKSLG